MLNLIHDSNSGSTRSKLANDYSKFPIFGPNPQILAFVV
jgi:hypothetical protein